MGDPPPSGVVAGGQRIASGTRCWCSGSPTRQDGPKVEGRFNGLYGMVTTRITLAPCTYEKGKGAHRVKGPIKGESKVVVGDGHLFSWEKVLVVAKGSCCSQTT